MTEDSNPTANKSWLERLVHAISNEPSSRQELLDVLRDAETRHILDPEAMNIIEGAMQVSDMRVREVMLPRTQIIMVDSSQTPEEFLPALIESGHSRFPVHGDSMDDIIGILHAKDLLPLVLNPNFDRFDIKNLLRPVNYVPESKRLNVLLQEFRNTHNHMAIVIDEYGSVNGVVTIEDVLEQIVGEIEDEYDVDDDSYIKKYSDNEYTIKALTPIEDFNEHFSMDFSDEEVDTVGGLVTQFLGRVPERGEMTTIKGFKFTVTNADKRKIRLLQVTPLDNSASAIS